jgi:hypothetical protein
MGRFESTPADLYQAWRAAFQEAGEALLEWWFAPAGARRDRFAAYRAAADREDAAADAWLVAAERYDAQVGTGSIAA